MRTVLTAVLSTIVLCGCKSASEKQLEAEAAMLSTPLAHDPTHDVELAQWWSNGVELLRLDDDAAYSLYGTQNRYEPPLERGRWSRSSYAVLWLEPYNTSRVDPRRVSITRTDGRLSLIIPRHRPMFALDRPPQMIEDRLIGQWRGEWGTLTLNNTMRYALTLSDQTSQAIDARRRSSLRKGTWRIVDKTLVLRPDLAGVDPLQLPLVIQGDEVAITSPDGPMTRVDPAVPPASEN